MDAQAIIITVLSNAVITTAALAVLQHLFSRNLEHQKAELGRETDQLKTKLDAVQFEHQTRFSLMQQKRADVIAALYVKLVEAQQALARWSSPMKFSNQDETQLGRDAAESLNALMDFFSLHRLYLGRAAADRCQSVLDMMRGAFIEYQMVHIDPETIKHAEWVAVSNKVSKEIPKALTEIEIDFHKVLGITD